MGKKQQNANKDVAADVLGVIAGATGGAAGALGGGGGGGGTTTTASGDYIAGLTNGMVTTPMALIGGAAAVGAYMWLR